MINIKLLALDLDDTLLNRELKISTEDFQAIKEAQHTGVQVAIATGRMYRSALPYAVELGLKLPLVAYHGALVKEMSNGSTISHQAVPLELALEIAQESEALGYHLNAYINDEVLVKEVTPEGLYYEGIANVPMRAVGSLTKALKSGPTKLLLINQEEKLLPLLEKWQAKYADQLFITKSKPNFLEITAAGVHKGYGVELLANSLNITSQEVMVVGDSYNDIAMFEFAGISVAMGNAKAQVQAKAHYVTDTNHNSGVAKAIYKYILGRRF